MIVRVLDKKPKWSLIEYNDSDGMVQRKMLPDCMTTQLSYEVNGTIDISQELLSYGVDIGSIDLTAVLGTQLPSMHVSELLDLLMVAGLWRRERGSCRLLPEMSVVKLQDMLRRNGLWSWQDYMGKPEIVLETLETLANECEEELHVQV